MAANALVQTRINEELKREATAVLAGVGLTVSDAVRLLLIKVVQEKALPFEIWNPNAQTQAAMHEANGIIKNRKARFPTAEALMNDLEEKTGK
jgi:DNA-damage-inducible protein J